MSFPNLESSPRIYHKRMILRRDSSPLQAITVDLSTGSGCILADCSPMVIWITVGSEWAITRPESNSNRLRRCTLSDMPINSVIKLLEIAFSFLFAAFGIYAGITGRDMSPRRSFINPSPLPLPKPLSRVLYFVLAAMGIYIGVVALRSPW